MIASAISSTALESHGVDAIAIIIADHQNVANLFAEFERLKARGSSKVRAAIVGRICGALSVHGQVEEEVFYPAVCEAIDDSDLMNEAMAHHAGSKELIAEMATANPDDPLYNARVTVLADQVRHHIKEVEREMLPQAIAANLDMAALGARMLERKEILVRAMGNSILTLAK